MIESILKYPRTQHIEGSRLQLGDEDLDSVPLAELAGLHLVIEEKLDGANAGISFTETGELRLQSRGHLLTGGHRERHFSLFKTWANVYRTELWDVLGDCYVAYGEWLYAKHTVFYDQLPHFFLEFDVFDREAGEFLSTPRRLQLFEGCPVVSVPVLWTGVDPRRADLDALIRPSLYKSAGWRENLASAAAAAGVEADRARRETDSSDDMEGLYLKVETDGAVVGRYKLIRASFLTSVRDSGSHWLDRAIIANRLAAGVDIFEAQS